MNIDWSKAPEWAVAHALWPFLGEVIEVWVCEYQFQRFDHTQPFPYGGGSGDAVHNPFRSQFRFEAERPAPWEGEGWPPVGTVCEMSLFASNKWERCQPVHYLEQPADHSDQVVVYQDSIGGEVCYILDPPCDRSIEFRPLRTPEQVAADEREAGITQMRELVGSLNTNPFSELWDAGYRKQVQP